MAEEPYLLDPETFEPVPLFDPRRRRRSSARRYSYDPRRRRRRSHSVRRSYDPQFRRYLGAARKKVSKWHLLGSALGLGAFALTMTKNDINTPGLATAPLGTRISAFFRSLIGRTTGMDIGGASVGILPGIGFYSGSPSWNWTKAFNSLFGIGAAAAGYGILSRMFGLRLPYASKAAMLGVPLAVGALIGGGLDPAPGATLPNPVRPALGPRATYTTGPAPVGQTLNGGLVA